MGIVIVVGLLLVAVAALVYGVGIYNGLVQVTNNMDKAWANIDVLLKQRHDEIPKLIAVCEGYKNFERQTLQAVIQARSEYSSASTQNQKVAAASHLTGAVRGLLAVAENYPDLKASQNFVQLQQRVSALEGQIADRREFFNESVNVYNIRIRQIPDKIVAGMLQLTPRTMFQVAPSDREDVKIAFSQ
jgi:LemA protein